MQKCSLKDHEEINANMFCQECRIYMCNKCINYHSNLFKNHHTINLDKNIKDIFTGLCQENNHLIKLEYFCKTHNVMCCSSCIAKIKKLGNCQHINCEVCTIEDISIEKKNTLLDNIKILEDLSSKLDNSINQLKELYQKIDKDKEDLKLKIQNIFTKLRNALNEREDQLISDIDKQFNKAFFAEDIIIESEKLPNNIKLSLERGKKITKKWDDKDLSSLINDCINIENNIKSIIKINENIKKINNIQSEIKIEPEEDGFLKFAESIKTFGNIYDNYARTLQQKSKKREYGNLFG